MADLKFRADKDYCRDCEWEARASLGFYSLLLTDTIPKDKVRQLTEAYDDQWYCAHELGNLVIVGK